MKELLSEAFITRSSEPLLKSMLILKGFQDLLLNWEHRTAEYARAMQRGDLDTNEIRERR